MENRHSTRASQNTSSKNVFFNLSIFQFLTFLRRGVFYTFMINYLFTLMRTVTSTAALGTFDMIASSLGQNLLWGRICDRYKTRAGLIIMGETIAAFAYIIVFFIHKSLIDAGNSFTAGLAIIFGLSVLEFFWSMSDVGWAALLTDVTTMETRGRIVGILNFIAALGRMVGIVFAGFLYANGEGFRNGTLFFTVPLLLLVGTTLMTFTSRSIKARNCTPNQASTVKKKAEDENKPTDGNEKTYRWFLASLVIIILGAASINQIILLYIKLPQGLNASDSQMSLILSAWTIGGMIASLASGRLTDRIGRTKIIFAGLGLAIVTPLLYSLATNVLLMALIYGLNGVAFWTIQTAGFVFAGDIIPDQKRGRLLSRFNTVMALGWGPAGILIGGPLADVQVKAFGVPAYAAYVNVFYASSIILSVGTLLFAIKIRKMKIVNNA